MVLPHHALYLQAGVKVAYLQRGGRVGIAPHLAFISIFQGHVSLIALCKVQHEQKVTYLLEVYLG